MSQKPILQITRDTKIDHLAMIKQHARNKAIKVISETVISLSWLCDEFDKAVKG